MLWVTEDQAHLGDQHELVETEGHEELETGGGGHEEAVHYQHLEPALGEAGHLPGAGDFVSIPGRGCSGLGLHHSGILLFCRDFQLFVEGDSSVV